MTTQCPLNDHPLAPLPLRCQCAGVPRRFGVGVMMLLVTMAAMLFALLETLGVPAVVFAIVSILFVGVAAGQVLLFGGQRPRDASLLVGACLFPAESFGLIVYTGWGRLRLPDLGDALAILVVLILVGAVLGYLAGILTAAVFLVLQRYGKDPEESAPSPVRLQPFTDADIDTLIDWTQSRWLFDNWAGTTFSYPLDRQQVLDHLGNAEGEQPQRRMFMAICPTTQRPVGYVELDRIDRQTHTARVDLALIASDESDRGRLCVALLSAMMEVAFAEMQLDWVDTIVASEDSITRDCYKEIGFHKEGVLSGGPCRSVWRLRVLDPRRMR